MSPSTVCATAPRPRRPTGLERTPGHGVGGAPAPRAGFTPTAADRCSEINSSWAWGSWLSRFDRDRRCARVGQPADELGSLNRAADRPDAAQIVGRDVARRLSAPRREGIRDRDVRVGIDVDVQEHRHREWPRRATRPAMRAARRSCAIAARAPPASRRRSATHRPGAPPDRELRATALAGVPRRDSRSSRSAAAAGETPAPSRNRRSRNTRPRTTPPAAADGSKERDVLLHAGDLLGVSHAERRKFFLPGRACRLAGAGDQRHAAL